jgi:hypothetical protein
MNYLPDGYSPCPSNPLLDQCKTCQRNIHNSSLDPNNVWIVWIGPWTGHGPCPDGLFVEKEGE